MCTRTHYARLTLQFYNGYNPCIISNCSSYIVYSLSNEEEEEEEEEKCV